MKRGQPLQRSAPLRNHSPIERRTRLRPFGDTKHSKRERGIEFMGWTSRQPCMVRRFWHELQQAAGIVAPVLVENLRCDGRIEVDHAGDRFTQGDGTRAFDWTCIPLCARHHRMRTSWAGTLGQAGIFFRYTREALRRWCAAAIAIHHALATSARIEVPSC